MAKILIIGSTGQLGRALVQRLADEELITPKREELDLFKTEEIFDRLNNRSFDVLINASAYNLTERAEEDPRPAFAINAHAVGEMARSCRAKGAIFVHVSSDYVFDGQKGSAYTEEDRVCPLNLYGCSKAMGEQLALSNVKELYILRTASLYGDGPSNFVKKIWAKQDMADVVDDIVMSPTSAHELAAWIALLLEKRGPFGLYHAVSHGEVSWYQFAKQIVEYSGRNVHVKPVKSSNAKMKRPSNSALCPTKLERVIGPISSWQEGLKQYVAQF